MNITRLRENKRRLYEILNLNESGQKVLNSIKNSSDLIVNYGSIKAFKDNKNKLTALLGVLLDGSLYILQYLNNIKDHRLNEVEYTKVLTDALSARGAISKVVSDFLNEEKIDEKTIVNFIGKLDTASDIDTTGNKFSNIVGVSVFKQIYTMMYNFVLDCNGITKRAKIKVKGGYTASTNIHGEEYEVIMPENIKTGGKKNQLLKWISSRWNWTLPICCYDKIIHCYSGYFEISENVHKYLPTIKYLSGELKCSAESLLNCYDVGYVFNNVILRTSKQIKNDGTGLYLSVRPTNRTYNFHNLRVKGDNSEQKSWYKLFINGRLVDMTEAEKTYNKNIKVSSAMQSFADYKGDMQIEPVKDNQPVQTQPVQTQPVQTQPVQTQPVQSGLLSLEQFNSKYKAAFDSYNYSPEQRRTLYEDYLKNPQNYK